MGGVVRYTSRGYGVLVRGVGGRPMRLQRIGGQPAWREICELRERIWGRSRKNLGSKMEGSHQSPE